MKFVLALCVLVAAMFSGSEGKNPVCFTRFKTIFELWNELCPCLINLMHEVGLHEEKSITAQTEK